MRRHWAWVIPIGLTPPLFSALWLWVAPSPMVRSICSHAARCSAVGSAVVAQAETLTASARALTRARDLFIWPILPKTILDSLLPALANGALIQSKRRGSPARHEFGFVGSVGGGAVLYARRSMKNALSDEGSDSNRITPGPLWILVESLIALPPMGILLFGVAPG